MAPRKKAAKLDKSEQMARAAMSVQDLASHHAAVREMLDPSFITQTDSQQIDLRVALQTIMRGVTLTQDQIAVQSAEVAKLKERMVKVDKEAAKYQTDRDRYVENVWDRADKLKLTGKARDELIAKEMQKFGKLKQNIAASNATDQLQFHAVIARQKKVVVVSAGKLVIQSRNGQQIPVLEPEVIRIKDMQWVLMPGVATEVPQIVADLLSQKKRSKQETEARKAVLSANRAHTLKDTDVAAQMEKINREFGVTTENFPIASSA